METEIPPAAQPYAEAIASALRDWTGTCHPLYAVLGGGRSGSVLLRVDITAPASTTLLGSGQYIMKVTLSESGLGAQRHRAATTALGSWAIAHIPELVATHYEASDTLGTEVTLLRVAGASLDQYMTPLRSDSTPLLRQIGRIVADLLDAQYGMDITDLQDERSLTRGWLSDRKLQEALTIYDQTLGRDDVASPGGHLVVHPRVLIESFEDKAPKFEFRSAILHGDLHTGNILLSRDSQSYSEPSDRYWLIDFDESRQGGIGFDQSYLFVHRLLLCLGGSGLVPTLAVLEATQGSVADVDKLPLYSNWTLQFCEQLTASEQGFALSTVGRADILQRQFRLARVIAALTWARRSSLEPGERQVACAVAGYFTRRYIQDYQEDAWDRIETRRRSPSKSPPGEASLTEAQRAAADQAWKLLREAITAGKDLFLITERSSAGAGLAVIGTLPWAVVCDLDPQSDADGVYAHAGPLLAERRGLHLFSHRSGPVDAVQGTAWVMLNGWATRGEPTLEDRQWVYQSLGQLRPLLHQTRRGGRIQEALVFALTGELAQPTAASLGSTRLDRLSRIAEAIDEAYLGKADTIVVGEVTPESMEYAEHLQLPPKLLMEYLGGSLPERTTGVDIQVPGVGGGLVSIPTRQYFAMTESFELLHARIELERGSYGDGVPPFYRGAEPSWSDLAEGLDVARTNTADLRDSIVAALESHRTRTIILQHEPGSGGTTQARRVAWDIHLSHPSVALRRDCRYEGDRLRALADRLNALASISGLPLFVLAEASQIPEGQREDLYRELVTRNVRATILYVRKVLSYDGGGEGQGAPPFLPEILPLDEAHTFEATYSPLCRDARRRAELDRLLLPSYERYRTPFFFGLATFDRDFTKVTDYVGDHLAGVVGIRARIIGYLALITLYADTGFTISTIASLVGVKRASSITLDQILGPSLTRLTIGRAGRVRLLHRLVAEQVMVQLYGEQFKHHLADIASDMITDLAAKTDSSADAVRQVLRELFTERVRFAAGDDRGDFAPLVEDLDEVDSAAGHRVLLTLAEYIPDEAHFWNHLGRHQVYRLGRDYEVAVKYLRQAVSLSPNDSIHHHTLGLVQRSGIRARLRQLGSTVDGSQIISTISSAFEEAANSFARSRELKPEDPYGYITDIQMTLEVADQIRRAERAPTVADVSPVVADWLHLHMTTANELIEGAASLYGTLDSSEEYLTECRANIEKLYGDLDRVIQIWELAVEDKLASSGGRRALAQAYYVRGRRSWRGMQIQELVRVAGLADANLRLNTRRDEDFRLWFEASSLLPDFDVDLAIERLSYWGQEGRQWRPDYYRWALEFFLWFAGRTSSTDEMERALQRCRERFIGRAKQSYLWLGQSPERCPLVPAGELGEWSRTFNFWKSTGELKRVNGYIDEYIQGPQSGRIVIGSGVSAFFVPAAGQFSANADENEAVHFFLGFSPDGLRAWDVKRGHVEGGSRIAGLGDSTHTQFAPRARRSVTHEQERKLRQSVRLDRVRTFAEDLLRARATQDHDMALGELESRVLAAFGSDVVLDILEFASLEGLLASLASVEVTGPAGEKRAALRGYLGLSEGPSVVIGSVRSFDITTLRGWVETATGASSFIADEDCLNRERVPSERSLVRVSPSSEGTPAALVEVLPPQISLYEGRLIDREELIGLVKNLMFRMVEDATVLGESQISLDGVARFVEQRIKGEGSLASRLGVASLEYLVTPADGLALVRAGDGVGLRLARRVADVERDSASLAPPSPNAEGERMVVETARRLIRSGPIAGTIINSELSRVLGPDLYRGLRGSRKLGQFLRDLGLEVYPDSQGKFGPKIGPKGPGFMVPDPEPSAPIHPPKIQIDLAEPTGAGTNVRPISHAEYKESIARALTGEEFRETVNAQGAEGQISLVTFAALLGRLGPECDYKRAGFPRLKIALQYALTGSAFCLVPAAWNSADFSLTRRTESRGQCLPDLSSEDLAASHGIREFLGKCNPPLRFESQETLTAVCRHLSQGANQPSTLHDLEQRVLEAHPALAPESVKVALQLLTLVGVITGNSEVSLQERAMALNPACYTYESMRERLQSAAEAALEAHRWPTSPGALVELLPISAPAPEFPR